MSEGAMVKSDQLIGLAAAGKAAIERKKVLNELTKLIEGLTWGSGSSIVRGSDLSPHSRWALAEYARVTGANLVDHVDILGGKPYLNVRYWSDLVASNEYTVKWFQRDLSPSHEAKLRELAQAKRARAQEAADHGLTDLVAKYIGDAMALEDEADQIAADRSRWGARQSATAVVETTIVRFIPSAPLEEIRSGKITDVTPFLMEVKECNWAGGLGNEMASFKKFDPIGDAFPATTARSRSFRRAAVRAFSAWLKPMEEQIKQIEQIIEAEWSEVKESNHDMVMHQEPQEDVSAIRKAYFGLLRKAGITEEGRKAWQLAHGFTESTKDWKVADFTKAISILESQTAEPVESDL